MSQKGEVVTWLYQKQL